MRTRFAWVLSSSTLGIDGDPYHGTIPACVTECDRSSIHSVEPNRSARGFSSSGACVILRGVVRTVAADHSATPCGDLQGVIAERDFLPSWTVKIDHRPPDRQGGAPCGDHVTRAQYPDLMDTPPFRPTTIYLPQYAPRLAVCGHIKNGEWYARRDPRTNEIMIKDGKPQFLARQLDHYVVTKLEKDEQTNNFLEDEAVMAALPRDRDGKVRRIPIFVYSDDLAEFFPMSLVGRVGKTPSCYGDGKRAMRTPIEAGQKLGKAVEIACPCEWLDKNRPRGAPVCKGNGALRCKIALPESITIGSVYDFHTSSEIGLPEMLGGLTEIFNVIGTLVWVPMWLELRSRTVQPEGYPKTVWTSFIHLRSDNVRAAQAEALAVRQGAMELRRLTGRSTLTPILPPSPMDEDGDPSVLEEFYEAETEGRGADVALIGTSTSAATVTASAGANVPSVRGVNDRPASAAERHMSQSTQHRQIAAGDDKTTRETKTDAPKGGEGASTRETKRKFIEMLGKLSMLVYGTPATTDQERAQRREAMWNRINVGVEYRFTTLDEAQYARLIEIIAGHIELEEGLNALEALMFDEDERKNPGGAAERRKKVWERVTIGTEIAYDRISPADLEDLIDHIGERLAIAHETDDDDDEGNAPDDPQGGNAEHQGEPT